MDLSIIIINWNSREYVQKCLLSLAGNPLPEAAEIIVLDSGSYDGCGEMIRDQFPSVRFIQEKNNVGFARANNIAAEYALGATFLFLNPDTEVKLDAIPMLYTVLQSRVDAGAVGARLLNTDGTLQTSCVQAFPTLLNQILTSDLSIRMLPQSRLWGRAPIFVPSDVPVEADVISGAAIMMRRDVFERVGGFCERYFMYSEDVELCLKARRAGFRNYYVGAATIVHHGGGSSNTQPSLRSIVLKSESARLYFERNHSQLHARCYRLAMAIAALTRIAVLAPWALISHRKSGSIPGGKLKTWIGVLNWCFRSGIIPPMTPKSADAICCQKA